MSREFFTSTRKQQPVKQRRSFYAAEEERTPTFTGMEDVVEQMRERHQGGGQASQLQQQSDLEQLQALQKQQSRYLNDADGNSQVRSQFRVDRNKRKRQLAQGTAFGWRKGLALLEGSTKDEMNQSKTAVFGDCRTEERKKWKNVQTASIFSNSSSSFISKQRKRESTTSSTTESVQPDLVSSTNSSLLSRRQRPRKQTTIETVDLSSANEEERETKPIAVPETATAVEVPKKQRLVVVPSLMASLAPLPPWQEGLSSVLPIGKVPPSSIGSLVDYSSSSDSE